MTAEQIEVLKVCVANSKLVIWTPDLRTARTVISIGRAPVDAGGESEPSEVAYFAGGEYVALYNVDLWDFVLGQRLGLS